jgi:hypothetical protein
VDDRQFGYITKLRKKKPSWYGQQQQACGKSENFPTKKIKKRRFVMDQ